MSKEYTKEYCDALKRTIFTKLQKETYAKFLKEDDMDKKDKLWRLVRVYAKSALSLGDPDKFMEDK